MHIEAYIQMEKRGACSNLQLIEQHVCHLDSERVPCIHLLYNVNELLHHQAYPIIPVGTQSQK